MLPGAQLPLTTPPHPRPSEAHHRSAGHHPGPPPLRRGAHCRLRLPRPLQQEADHSLLRADHAQIHGGKGPRLQAGRGSPAWGTAGSEWCRGPRGRPLGVRTGSQASGLPGQCLLCLATQTVLPEGRHGEGSSQTAGWRGGGGPGRLSWTRGALRSPSVFFLGCLHRGRATMSPKRPWPSNGCWKSEQSRTSLTSDLGGSCTHPSAHSAA